MGARGLRDVYGLITPMRRWLWALGAGLLASLSVVVVAALVWAGVPTGAPVLHSGTDTATVSTLISDLIRLRERGSDPSTPPSTAWQLYSKPGGLYFQEDTGTVHAISLNELVAFSGVLTPTQITSDQNDYNPTGLAAASLLRLAANASWNITGLAGGSAGRLVTIHNVGSQPFVLKVQSSFSTLANRFAFTADLTMEANAMAVLQYDSTSSRWRAVSAVGSGGVGGSSPEKAPAQASTTVNINLSNPGTASFDGVTLSNGQRLLVPFQDVQTENGIYIFNGSSSALQRSLDADQDIEFVDNFLIFVQAGTLYGTTTWRLTNTAPVTLGSTNITFATDPKDVKTSAINAPNGVVGANSAGRVGFTGAGNYAAHAALATPNTITPTQQTMGIQSAGGAVNLSSAPQIAPGTYHGQRLLLKGIHASNTIQIDHGDGVRLCGNAGSVILGLNAEGLDLEWNSDLSVWQEIGCQGLNRLGSVNRDIFGAVSSATALRIGKDSNDHWRAYFDGTENRLESIISGAVSGNSTMQLGVGGFFTIKKHDGADLFKQANDTGAVTGVSLDAEGTNNVITLPAYWDLDLVGVIGGTASHIWNDSPLDTACTPLAVTGTNRTTGYCTFPDSDGDYGRQITRYLPDGWTGSFDAEIWWKTTGTGNARFQVQTKCYADDAADDAAFNTASVVTAAAGTSGRPNKQTITGITTTGCAAGQLMRIRVFRNRTEASDTLTAALDVEKVIFKLRLAH